MNEMKERKEQMKFYIASSFKNIDSVLYVSEKLKSKGHIHTYDWTKNEKVPTAKELKEIGEKEKAAILEADLFVMLRPAGKGSHVELGLALGNGKKTYVYSPTDEVFSVENTTTFYHLPEVELFVGTLDALVGEVSFKKL